MQIFKCVYNLKRKSTMNLPRFKLHTKKSKPKPVYSRRLITRFDPLWKQSSKPNMSVAPYFINTPHPYGQTRTGSLIQTQTAGYHKPHGRTNVKYIREYANITRSWMMYWINSEYARNERPQRQFIKYAYSLTRDDQNPHAHSGKMQTNRPNTLSVY